MDLRDFKLNEEGSFSITRPYESYQIITIMKDLLGDLSTLTITDATACMGGDTINFLKYFKFVNIVEKKYDNFKLLEENINKFYPKYALKSSLYNKDYLELQKYLEQDVIYIDPEWSGPGYKNKKSITLMINDTPLHEIIPLLSAKMIFIKAPVNVSLENIKYDNIYNIYNKSKNIGFYLIVIKNQ